MLSRIKWPRGFGRMKIAGCLSLAVITSVLVGCWNMHGPGALQSVSINGRPVGGTPTVDIPHSAYAMGAYLKAQIAADNGQRAEALKNYESAVKYDPHNAGLRVQLANLYIRAGRLKHSIRVTLAPACWLPGSARPWATTPPLGVNTRK